MNFKDYLQTKYLLYLLIIIALIIILPLTIYLTQQRQIIKKRAANIATVHLDPATQDITQNSTITVNIRIDSGEDEISFADISYTFDKNRLEVVAINYTDALDDEVQAPVIDNNTGFFRLILRGTPSLAIFPSGNFVIATVTFKGMALGTASVEPKPDMEIVKRRGSDIYSHGGSTGGQYTVVTLLSPTPTTTPTPTLTVTPTPTATPTLTPTITLTPTPAQATFRFRIRLSRISHLAPTTIGNITVSLKNLNGVVVDTRTTSVERVNQVCLPIDPPEEECINLYEGNINYDIFGVDQSVHAVWVLIKGPAHLQREMGTVTLYEGQKAECLEEKPVFGYPLGPFAGCWGWYVDTKPLLSGDGNHDGRVSGIDYEAWRSAFADGVTIPNTIPDYDFTNVVSGIDYDIWLQNFDKVDEE